MKFLKIMAVAAVAMLTVVTSFAAQAKQFAKHHRPTSQQRVIRDVTPMFASLDQLSARRHHHAHHHGSPSTSLVGVVEPLASKAREIVSACPDTKIVSTIRGWGVTSNHRLGKAVDIAVSRGSRWSYSKSDYGCLYAHLAGWPGGYSGDPYAVGHVHISYSHEHEWGNHGFAHGGGHSRYASRHHHQILAAHDYPAQPVNN